jgi:outer membrane protein TolC
MMHFRNITLLLLCSAFAFNLSAQRDSIVSLPLQEFLNIVRSYHPMALSAELQLENAESFERRARGAFDPKLEANFNEKFYKETSYFSEASSMIKMPTRSPLSLKAGYDLNDGTFLDQSKVTPDDGLITAGVSMPLLQGLLIDERRTAMRVSQAFEEFSIAERASMYNQLIFESYGAYWNWWSSVEKRRIAQEMLDIASIRFDAVKQRALAGDRPFIDTVEAYLQVQLRQQQLLENITIEVKSRFFLSGFLWYNDDTSSIPTGLIISEKAVPENPMGQLPPELMTISRSQILTTIDTSHPIIIATDANIKQMEAEARWKQEKLKPKLDVEYNFLNTGLINADDIMFSTRNYKWGLNFSFPIFLREARGDLQLTRIKIAENNYVRDLKAVELSNKANAAFTNVALIRDQTEIARANVANYRTLLDAERLRFFNGESSLFIVNQREMQLADAQNKLVDLQSKLEMASAEVLYFLGQLK